MEMRKIEAFCQVVELKSFTRAAEKLLLSQPTISEHVRSLEEELEQKLLDRLGKEVELTPVGKLFYGYARKILRCRQEAVQAVQQFGGKVSGRILAGCGTIPGTYILPELIGRFRTQYPLIAATLCVGSSRIISKKVLNGELELGVVGAKWKEAGLNWTEMFSDELTLVTHPDHPWANRASVSILELPGQPFIMREAESGTRKVFAGILEENGMKEGFLQEVAEIGSTAAIKEAIKAGMGISVISKRAVAEDIKYGRLASLNISDHKLKRPFYLIRRKNRALSPVATIFLEYLQQNS